MNPDSMKCYGRLSGRPAISSFPNDGIRSAIARAADGFFSIPRKTTLAGGAL